jgi:hypothetical protein
MSKISKTTAANRTSVPGMMDTIQAELDGWSIDLQSWDVDMDFAVAFKGLPNDMCPASHVGYVIKGSVTMRMADGSEDVYEAGDAYVLPPGHIPSVAAGSEFVTFTPIEEAKAMEAVVQQNMMQYAAEQGIDVSG